MFRNRSGLQISRAIYNSFHASRLPAPMNMSTGKIGRQLTVSFREQTAHWNRVFDKLPAEAVKKHAPHIMNTAIVLSKQQAEQLAELKSQVRIKFLENWFSSLENYPSDFSQERFNLLVSVFIREQSLLEQPKVSLNLEEQFRKLNTLGLLEQTNFTKMMENPFKMEIVLDILFKMKIKNMLNGDPAGYQTYLNKLYSISTTRLTALNHALNIGPYSTKNEMDVLLDKADYLDKLCPVHSALHAKGLPVTLERLKKTQYYDVAEYMLKLLEVPDVTDEMVNVFMDNHTLLPRLCMILDLFKSDLKLKSLLLHFLLDRLDQLDEIMQSMTHVRFVLSLMDVKFVPRGLEIVLNNLDKLPELATLAKESPILFNQMSLETLKLALNRIEGQPREEVQATKSSMRLTGG